MTDDPLGREIGAWLGSTEPPLPESRLSLHRTMSNVALTSQVPRSRLAAILTREAIPTEPAGDPSRHQHTRLARNGGSAGVTAGGSQKMLITATSVAVTAALVLAGSVFLTGLQEEPLPPIVGASQEPLESSAPQLVGSETVADDRFELTVTTPRTTWNVDEPIDVVATLRYIGEEPEAIVGSGREIVGFGIEQLDGPIDNGGFRRLPCARHSFASGDVETIPFQKSGGFIPDGEMGDFWRAWFDDPELRLPAGTYRLIASAEHGGWSCSDMATLEAAVMIEVVAEPREGDPPEDG